MGATCPGGGSSEQGGERREHWRKGREAETDCVPVQVSDPSYSASRGT